MFNKSSNAQNSHICFRPFVQKPSTSNVLHFSFILFLKHVLKNQRAILSLFLIQYFLFILHALGFLVFYCLDHSCDSSFCITHFGSENGIRYHCPILHGSALF
jgi:hypothetical protein